MNSWQKRSEAQPPMPPWWRSVRRQAAPHPANLCSSDAEAACCEAGCRDRCRRASGEKYRPTRQLNSSLNPCHANQCGLSNNFFGLVVGLAVTAQRCRPGAGIKLVEAGRDLGVFTLEQRIPVEVALDQEWTELFHVEHPHRLRQPKLFQPVNAGHALDTAAEQRAGAVADCGQIDRVVRDEVLAIGR